jgi:hypothetical protein
MRQRSRDNAMSTITVPPLTPTHLDAPVARTGPQHTHAQNHAAPAPSEILSNAENTTLSYSFDRIKQSLRIVVTDKVSGEVLRNIEFKSFHPNLHRTEKLGGLLLDQQA